ncbi:hypothetical protein FA95DRAFT_121568 [Auriscalpium vulgare]|uniref:Uncharacterized protein n=1 Tax=Auriscalpium vulgare TaxID=40419 RepID=A0ACB8RML8_9AGAM|nr:hypothetical protein FA95DRAFT_121568 [Auriscalpium vulgare]
MHESFRAISTSAIAQTRRAVDRTLAPRRMALDACARSLELAVYLNAPVAVCFLGLFWPARGLPVVSALSALVVSEALAALGRRIAGPLMHELAAIGLILGSMGHALSSGCTRPLSAIADDGPRVYVLCWNLWWIVFNVRVGDEPARVEHLRKAGRDVPKRRKSF